MKKLLLLLPLLALTGCALVHSTTYEPTTGKRQTSVLAFTWFDSHNSLTKLRNTSATTTNGQYGAGTSFAGLEQSSTATNVVAIVGSAENIVKMLAVPK